MTRSAALALPALVLLLPFEPRRPVVALFGLQLTLLEAAAALSCAALAWSARNRLAAVLRRPPLPVLFLGAFALAHVVASALAPAGAGSALKFSARMAAMAAFALLACAVPAEWRHRALGALAVAGAAVAALAVLEGAGVRALDPALRLFREMPFNVGGARRASAGSEYPNLAAAFIVYGLVAAAGLARPAQAGHLRAPGLVLALLLSAGLLFTYSRGALVAAAVGLLALAVLGAGRDRLAWRAPLASLGVLAAGTCAFALGTETFQLRLESEGVASWYGAEYRPADSSFVLRPGQAVTTTVEVRNTGLKTWSVDGAFHLSYHWYDPERRWLVDGGRTVLPRDVGPGEGALLRPEVRAPWREGRYLLVWDMVQEHTSWFSGQGVRPAVVAAVVSHAPDAAAAKPRAPGADHVPPPWRPGRGELWRLALEMWKERPLTGFGSDSFRHMYGPRAGRAVWDSRVYANNLYLEAAATTGTLGLAALVGALGAAALAALRAARSDAPGASRTATTLFALVTAMAVHGLADYLLAFTGHYLALGLVVGAAGAEGRA